MDITFIEDFEQNFIRNVYEIRMFGEEIVLYEKNKKKKKRKKKEKSLPLIIRNRKMTQRERKSQCPARVGQDRAYADVN